MLIAAKLTVDSVCVLLLTVLSFIFIYFTFFALPLIILSGVDTK